MCLVATTYILSCTTGCICSNQELSFFSFLFLKTCAFKGEQGVKKSTSHGRYYFPFVLVVCFHRSFSLLIGRFVFTPSFSDIRFDNARVCVFFVLTSCDKHVSTYICNIENVNFSVTINNYKTERKSILFLDHVATKHSFRGINVGTRSPALRYATTPNVRGEGIHVNQAFRT